MHFHSSSLADTDRLAAALAAAITPGIIVCLHGPLGAGKTTFVQGLLRALGHEHQFVNSPTFTLVQEYDARVPIYHIDAYRLRDADEFLELGGEEILSGDRAVLIEWAERIADALPRDLLHLTITPLGQAEREFRWDSTGTSSKRLADEVAVELGRTRNPGS